MSISQPIIPGDLEQFVLIQKKELQKIKEAFTNYCPEDELCNKAFQSFINHRIDDQITLVAEYFERNSKSHHLTPREIDTVLHYILKDLHHVASMSSQINLDEIHPKKMIMNWLKQTLLTTYRPKISKVKVLSELFRQYVVADYLEKDLVYERIKFQLNENI